MRLSECGCEVEECYTGSQGLGTVKLLGLQIEIAVVRWRNELPEVKE